MNRRDPIVDPLAPLQPTTLAQPPSDVTVTVDPPMLHRWDRMRVGVLQHLDRVYTYDEVPDRLVDGLLFQGLHRPPAGMSIRIELARSATLWFFFHPTADGGYGELFAGLPDWTRDEEFPRYDLAHGDHGRLMVMYRRETAIGQVSIPPTTRDKACFGLVVRFDR